MHTTGATGNGFVNGRIYIQALSDALALTSAVGVQVAIYERAAALSRRGAGLGLDVNGQKALRAIDPGAVAAACRH
jgi:2-polyprenyl-6-methoxyphenol hydroxylase-like FAD-dependent oxidoreductase